MSAFSDDFNLSAQKFQTSPATADLLLTKYSALQTFKLTEREDKEQLAAALLATAEKFLTPHATPGKGFALDDDAVGHFLKVLAVLGEQENAQLLPKRAPEALADLALGLVRKAETIKWDECLSWDHYQRYLPCLRNLAKATLQCAKKVKAVADRQTEEFSTSKTFTVPRPLVLKKDDKGSAP